MHDHAKHDPTSPKLVAGVHCQHIRHKGMFVMSEPNPEALKFYDECDSAAYWCGETGSSFGPDGHPVRPDCCAGERCCCSH
jgi:hypothetical protein